MGDRIIGYSNPNRESLLKNKRAFEPSQTPYSAAGRTALSRAHTAKRNAYMLELMCGLSAMVSAGRAKGGASRLSGLQLATVSCAGAFRQGVSYSDGNVAAHVLPGQILLSGLEPYHYISNSVGRIFLKDLFEEVDRLPVNFNRADSAAEDGPGGLKELAEHVASRLIRDGSPRSGGMANREFVYNLYNGLWLPGVHRSLLLAVDKKEEKPQVPKLAYAKPTFDKGPESFDPHLIDPKALKAIEEAGNYEWNITETTEIAKENLLHAAEGPSTAELPDIAARAESALKGHARAIELINV